MHDEFHHLLKKFPLIASKNPQLNLLDEEDLTGLQVCQSDLYRKLWSEQRKKTARYSADTDIRRLVAPADRFRDITRAHPVETNDSIEWPVFDAYGLAHGFETNPQDCDFRSVLQTPTQGKELKQLIEKITQQLAFSLSHPCPVFEDRYSVRVEFLDCIAWVALKVERLLKMEVKDSKGDWQLSTFRFDLLKPMQTKSWVDQLLLAWVADIVLIFGDEAESAYQWLRKEIESRFHNKISLSGIRHQIRHHMSIAPGMIEACLHVKQQTGRRRSLMNADVNEMWHAAEFWTELHEKYPQLTLLCYLAAKSKKGRPILDVSEIRSHCLEHGLSPAGWRYLLKVGEPCYRAIFSSGIGASRAFSIAIGLIDWQCRSGMKESLPQDMAIAFINFAALALLDGLNIAELVDPRLAKTAVTRYQNLGQAKDRADFVEKDWLEILIWLRNARPQIEKNQWRAGWPCIWRRYETWLLGRDTTTEWDSCVRKISIFGNKVIPLTSSRELCLEGMKMNNCVSSYANACLAGTYRLFSIREAKTDKRIASVGLCFSDKIWKLDQVKGKNNRDVSSTIETMAKSLAQFYQQTDLQYRKRTRLHALSPGTGNSTRRNGFYHVKVSAENHLMSRSDQGPWELARYREYPISLELGSSLGPDETPATNGNSAASPVELAVRLRLELPAEFSVYIWDAAENRDRVLSLN
jgi:hypothetical protein